MKVKGLAEAVRRQRGFHRGSPQNHRGFPEFVSKLLGFLGCASKPRPKTDRDQDSKTGLTGLGRGAMGSFEAGGTWRDRRAYIEVRTSAVEACSLDGSIHVLTKTLLYLLEL